MVAPVRRHRRRLYLQENGCHGRRFRQEASGLVLSATLPALILASVLNVDSLPDPVLMGADHRAFRAQLYAVHPHRLPGHPTRCASRGRRGCTASCSFSATRASSFTPVLSAIFGPQTVVYAVVYNIVFNLLSFTFGAWLIASDNEYGVKVRMSWRDFVTPCNIATLITMALAFFGVLCRSWVGPALPPSAASPRPPRCSLWAVAGEPPATKLLGALACGSRAWSAWWPPAAHLRRHAPSCRRSVAGVVVVLAAMPNGNQRHHVLLPVRRRRQDHGARAPSSPLSWRWSPSRCGNVLRGCFIAGAGRWAHLPTLFLRFFPNRHVVLLS